MPELPEVETVVNSLRPALVDRTIVAAEVLLPKMIKLCAPDHFCREVTGRRVVDLTRRGKYFIIEITGDWLIVGHLRMTGRLVVAGADIPREKYTHIIFDLDNRNELRFADMRQFGCLYLVKSGQVERIKGLATLGPEPLACDLTPEEFNRRLEKKTGKVKQLLLNQQFIAGIGNIYADEILYEAGINPNRPVNSLTRAEVEKIFHSMRHILRQGIRHRGTSIKDYVDGFGEKGEFQNLLRVYGRTGQDCINCGRILTREKLGGRSTHYCPVCQR